MLIQHAPRVEDAENVERVENPLPYQQCRQLAANTVFTAASNERLGFQHIQHHYWYYFGIYTII